MGESIKIGLVDTTTPGADSNTYILFDSTVCFAAPNHSNGKSTGLRSHCISRVCVNLENGAAGTLKSYRSSNKGTTWYQFGGDIVVAAAAATDISGPYDYLVDTYDDVRISWVNGGSAQDPWSPEVTAVRGDRASGV
jgi:hypothetical protein